MIRRINSLITCGFIGFAISSGIYPASATDIDIQAAGTAIGIETGKRWCNGEDLMKAIELSILTYFTENDQSFTDLSEDNGERIGEEVALEGFAYAFQKCPTRAKMIFKSFSNQ